MYIYIYIYNFYTHYILRSTPLIRPSVGPSVRPSVRPSASLFVCPPSVHLFVRPSICPSVGPSVRLSFHPFVLKCHYLQCQMCAHNNIHDIISWILRALTKSKKSQLCFKYKIPLIGN